MANTYGNEGEMGSDGKKFIRKLFAVGASEGRNSASHELSRDSRR